VKIHEDTLLLLKSIGLPGLVEGENPPLNKALSLLQLAELNKIPLLYLEPIRKFGKHPLLNAQLSRYRDKHRKTLDLTAQVSSLLEESGIPYTIFKTLKPFPHTPADIDILLRSKKGLTKASQTPEKRDLETTQRNNECMFFILREHLLDSIFICVFIHAPINPSMVSESLNQKLGLRGVEMHKKLAVASLFLIVLPLISLSTNIARAATPTMWASYVVDYWQGPRKDGSPVLSIRSNPNNALGPPDSGVSGPPINFFSLGFGGWIILGFPNPIANGPGHATLVIETTWCSYPLERADVYVSQDGTTWVYAGTVDNGYGQSGYGLVSLPEALTWVLYVQIVDTTDPNPHRGDADGYDLDAVGALYPSTWALIDIDPDTLNLKSKGNWITCYIQLPEGFNVADIDVNTVLLEHEIPAEWGYLQDGVLMVKFDRATVIEYIRDVLGVTEGEVTLTVTGRVAGTLFVGTDTTRVIMRGHR